MEFSLQQFIWSLNLIMFSVIIFLEWETKGFWWCMSIVVLLLGVLILSTN
jgi:hypothetical protein